MIDMKEQLVKDNGNILTQQNEALNLELQVNIVIKQHQIIY